jgi:23S rRNA pseudoU1915 N3-methylase RlmH
MSAAMHIELLLLGKTRRREIRDLLDDYVKRISRFAQIEVRELREDSPAAMRRLELPPGATMVLLDAAGKKFDSAQSSR